MRAFATVLVAIVPSLTLAAPPRVSARLGAIAGLAVPADSLAASDGRIAVTVWLPGHAADLVARFDAAAITNDLAVVNVTAQELARLVAHPGVVAVEPVRRLHTMLDRSVPLTGAPMVRQSLGLDGRGSIVGIVDTGADFRHADLRNADGTTRILALLDVSAKRDGRHPGLPDYGGAVWLRDEIDAQLAADAAGLTPTVPVTERDTNGHGTHVAGIAAGDGLATGNGLPAGRYVGMAPGATLVIAQAAHGGFFNDGDILHGIQFVFDSADRVGAPAVVNLSLGGSGGPHDGTTNLERAISSLVPAGGGRSVIIAAGNDGSRDRHAGGWSLDGTVDVAVAVSKAATADTRLTVDFWADPGARNPSFTVIAPDGHAFGPVLFGKSSDFGKDSSEGQVMIGNEAALDPINHRKNSFVDVAAVKKTPIQSGTWHIVLDGQVRRWDGWMDDGVASAPQPRFLTHIDEDQTSGLPAFAASAISVGSFVSRDHWTTVDGMMPQRRITVGRMSTFSGAGPTFDGRFAPDLAAPGEFIGSSLSSDAQPPSPLSVFSVAGDQTYLWADDGQHAFLRGTSQATPHVTGATAILYQVDPTLTVERLREVLRSSAMPAPGELGFSPRSGFGHLDVALAVSLLTPPPPASVDAAASSVGVSRDLVPPGETPILVSVVPRDHAGVPLGAGHRVAIESDSGSWAGGVTDLGAGRYQRVLLPHAPLRSIATIAAAVDGVGLDERPRVYFFADRSDIGAPFVAAGGCDVAPARPGLGARSLAGALLAALLLLVAAMRPRRRRAGKARMQP